MSTDSNQQVIARVSSGVWQTQTEMDMSLCLSVSQFLYLCLCLCLCLHVYKRVSDNLNSREQSGISENLLQWGLVCGNDYLGELITTLQFVGLIIGAGAGGQLSDAIGRKKTYFLVQFLMLTSTLVSAFANSWQLYAVCR